MSTVKCAEVCDYIDVSRAARFEGKHDTNTVLVCVRVCSPAWSSVRGSLEGCRSVLLAYDTKLWL